MNLIPRNEFESSFVRLFFSRWSTAVIIRNVLVICFFLFKCSSYVCVSPCQVLKCCSAKEGTCYNSNSSKFHFTSYIFIIWVQIYPLKNYEELTVSGGGVGGDDRATLSKEISFFLLTPPFPCCSDWFNNMVLGGHELTAFYNTLKMTQVSFLQLDLKWTSYSSHFTPVSDLVTWSLGRVSK